jgi:hypothetical protein
MTEEIEWLVPPRHAALAGDAVFTGIPGKASVQDFWKFALGDLRMNNARGYLAEFLVGTALCLQNLERVEWDSYDLLFDGITIEVKSSAHLQSWEQKRISALSFSGLQGTRLHARAPGDGLDPLGRRYNAMVYVFCAHTAKTHAEYDQLDASQWEFHVVPRSVLAATGQQSIGIARLEKLSHGPTPWAELASKITAVSAGEEREDDNPGWWTKG